jgi:hypothetical protein
VPGVVRENMRTASSITTFESAYAFEGATGCASSIGTDLACHPGMP